YFRGKRMTFSVPIRFDGTDFQNKVWHALTEIPYGQTVTYKEVAEKIGNPKAVRAVGNANNRNPIAIVVPCHRVIGADGKLVGYGGGLEMKEKLLKLEGAILT
ncbi:MAG: methylated-DNA--[protein]-cysteine S-methyltransferase, partial [bacterium]